MRQHLFSIVLLLNVASVFTGLWYYWDQLSATPWHLLIFVPDCPLYVLLAIPILLKRVKNGAYSFLVSIGMVKYGLWTVFVLLYHSKFYFLPEFLPVTLVFIIGHLGMALEGACLLPKNKVAFAALLVAFGWFLLNDFADYFLGTVPSIPPEGMGLVALLTIASSMLLPLALFAYPEKIRSLPPVRFGRWLIQN